MKSLIWCVSLVALAFAMSDVALGTIEFVGAYAGGSGSGDYDAEGGDEIGD